MNTTYSEAVKTAQTYYDGAETDRLYATIWGGEHITYGIYKSSDEPIYDASKRTVETIAQTLENLAPDSRVIDLGAGYGGAARYLAKTYGCSVCCLNLSERQNQRNRQLNQQQNLAHLVEVTQGSFEDIPYPDNSFNIVWSQDAILHSSDRSRVFEEIKRVLQPGGELIFTDPMQKETCPPGLLQPAFDRLGIKDMGSYRFYSQTAQELGFEELHFIDLSENAPIHYRRFGKEVRERYEEVVRITSTEFADKTLKSIEPWIEYYEKGYMQWGILHFRLG
ncbi:methyltransferase domain-containing protein [Moorena producens JHB]|uniref:Methyltransferase domain-containing protein n=1 Tax=Moorena producens (strain JHB) TaxID=1454205 RepID=A0A1D9G7A2_MOOP1|nr:methyltransferase domain-containing protein [Moorena producens]AOY83443.1 methyltransferase domain-containing protein [Moorena producens JHB]